MGHSYAALSIIAVVLVSACVQLGDVFGKDVLTINRKVSEEGFKDVLLIKDAKSIPKSPVLPDQPVLFSFIIENVDKTETAKAVVADLFNAPLFKSYSQQYRNLRDKAPLCNSGTSPCVPDICSRSSRCEVLPGEQRSMDIDLFSPSESEIARIKTDTELSYKVSYDFKGTLLYTVPVVNQDEIRTRQRQGQSISLTEQLTHSSGPVQVDVQLFGTPYLLSGFSGTFIFNVKNKGHGNIANSQIPRGGLKIEFPLDLFAEGAILTTPGDVKYTPGGALVEGGISRALGSLQNIVTGNAVIFSAGTWVICKSDEIGYYCDPAGCGSDMFVEGGLADAGDCGNRVSGLPPPSFGQYTQPGGSTSENWVLCQSSEIGYYCNPDSCGSDRLIQSGFSSAGDCGVRAGSSGGGLIPYSPQTSQQGPLFICEPSEETMTGPQRLVLRCVNYRSIDLFRDETRTTLRFSIDKVAAVSEPFRTYLIRAFVNYKYELRDSFPITIRPFEK